MDAAAVTIAKEFGDFGHSPAAVADLQPDGDPTIGLLGGKLVGGFGQGLGSGTTGPADFVIAFGVGQCPACRFPQRLAGEDQSAAEFLPRGGSHLAEHLGDLVAVGRLGRFSGAAEIAEPLGAQPGRRLKRML